MMSRAGMTPVLLAVEEGHLEIVRFFLHNDEIGTEHLEDEELFGGLLHKAMRRRTDVLLMSCPPQWKTRKTEETDTRTSPAQSEKKVKTCISCQGSKPLVLLVHFSSLVLQIIATTCATATSAPTQLELVMGCRCNMM